jgi:hypothetical protein
VSIRTVPECDYEREDLAEVGAEPWMVEAIACNPSYPWWGPHEDYMAVNGDGWNSPIYHKTWPEFSNQWDLDDMNECANWYFHITDRGLGLVLWILHPRKGASRGVSIARVERTELPAVATWLQEAAERNAERFAGTSRFAAIAAGEGD